MRQHRLNQTKTTQTHRQPQAATYTKSRSNPLLQLQSAIGNRATHHLIVSQQQGGQSDATGQPPMQAKPMFRGLSQELTSQQQQRETLLRASSGGQPMPEAVQEKMEAAFGSDFSAVRIHQGSEADSIDALAYTQGNHIHFQPSQYNPTSQRGQQLLGHELTHVLQQRMGRVAVPQGKSLPINTDSALEAQADNLGAKAARGEPAQLEINRAAVSPMQMSVAPIQCTRTGKKLRDALLEAGSGVSPLTADALGEALEEADVLSGGIGLVEAVSLVSAGVDAKNAVEAWREGDKTNAAISSAKAGLGFAASGTSFAKNVAKMAGSSATEALDFASGGLGVAKGTLDTALGGYSIYKAKESYKKIKDIARLVAEPQAASSTTKLNTQKLTEKQKELIAEIAKKELEITEFMGTTAKQLITSAKGKTAEQILPEIEKTLKNTNLLKKKADLEKRNDLLEVALEAIIIMKKVKNRAIMNTTGNAGQTLGGSLSLAGSAGAGFGAIPGIAVTGVSAAIKPGAYTLRKSKQALRDRGTFKTLFDEKKTTANKQQQRSKIAALLLTHSQDSQMQEIFKNLLDVSKQELEDYKSNKITKEDIEKILKRRG